MQKKRAVALQQEWGGKPCDHPAFAKEYDLGARTGNYICTQCGKTFTFREKAEIVAARPASATAEDTADDTAE
jgi:hypothetical protein